MKWYLAKLVFRVLCTNGDHKPQFDEQLRLICAADDLQAFHKARRIGEMENADDLSMPVKWKFINVSELHFLSELSDGTEVYSKLMEEDEPEKFIDNVHKRSNGLLHRKLHELNGLN